MTNGRYLIDSLYFPHCQKKKKKREKERERGRENHPIDGVVLIDIRSERIERNEMSY